MLREGGEVSESVRGRSKIRQWSHRKWMERSGQKAHSLGNL